MVSLLVHRQTELLALQELLELPGIPESPEWLASLV